MQQGAVGREPASITRALTHPNRTHSHSHNPPMFACLNAYRHQVGEVPGRVHLRDVPPKVGRHSHEVAQVVACPAPHPPPQQAHAGLVAEAGRICKRQAVGGG